MAIFYAPKGIARLKRKHQSYIMYFNQDIKKNINFFTSIAKKV